MKLFPRINNIVDKKCNSAVNLQQAKTLGVNKKPIPFQLNVNQRKWVDCLFINKVSPFWKKYYRIIVYSFVLFRHITIGTERCTGTSNPLGGRTRKSSSGVASKNQIKCRLQEVLLLDVNKTQAYLGTPSMPYTSKVLSQRMLLAARMFTQAGSSKPGPCRWGIPSFVDTFSSMILMSCDFGVIRQTRSSGTELGDQKERGMVCFASVEWPDTNFHSDRTELSQRSCFRSPREMYTSDSRFLPGPRVLDGFRPLHLNICYFFSY